MSPLAEKRFTMFPALNNRNGKSAIYFSMAGVFILATIRCFGFRLAESFQLQSSPPCTTRGRKIQRRSVFDSVESVFADPFSFIRKQGGSGSSSDDALQRAKLKEQLIEMCSRRNRERVDRGSVEDVISELADLSPVRDTAKSSLLQKEWQMLWTTEKEINVFCDWGISTMVTQTIDGEELGNLIKFKNGGGLGVSGKLSIPSSNDGTQLEREVRTNFKFTSATIDLGGWGRFNLPPVGKGWFDTVYVDEDLRVDTNSRDDILVCLSEIC